MTEEITVGPRLTDERFFGELIDTTRDGLREIPEMVARGDYTAARRTFAAEVRRTLQPGRFPFGEGRRENAYAHYGETKEAAAERILRLELISCGTPHQFVGEVDWFANPTYNQYKEWTWQLSRHWEWDLLAELYRETGDERYVEGIVRFFRSWVRQAVVPEPTPGNQTLCWRTIEAGIRMGQSWPRTLHSIINSPHFTDDVLIDWYKSTWEHGWRLRNFYWVFNWLIMEMNGLIHIGILFPQFKDAPEWKAYATNRLVRELDLQNFADGFQYELSTGYHQVNIRNYQLPWNLMEAYGEPVPDAFRDELEKMHSVNVRMMMPDGRLPDLNDGTWHRVSELMREAVRCYPDRADFRWALTEGREGSPPDETSLAFPYSGYYIMRDGWQRDSIWAFFDGGHLGTNHQHEDKLNLMIHAYGRLLLTEGGNYAYDDSPMRRYCLSTRSHNTIRVDGLDQNRRGPFRQRWLENGVSEDEIITELNTLNRATWRITGDYDLAEAEYDEGYGPEAVRLVTHRRKVIFLKNPPAPLPLCFVVIDRLLPNDNARHEYSILWHYGTDSAGLASDNPLASSSQEAGKANLAIIAAGHPNLSLNMVVAQEEPEFQGWRSRGHSQQKSEEPAPTADYCLNASGPQRVVTLLVPLPAGESCPVVRLSAEGAVTATGITLHLHNGESITLDEQDFPE